MYDAIEVATHNMPNCYFLEFAIDKYREVNEQVVVPMLLEGARVNQPIECSTQYRFC